MSSPAPDPSLEAIEIGIPLDRLVALLGAPDGISEGQTAEVIQTHISVVFLTQRRAIKIKKPVRLWGLLDYGTIAARKYWCEEEVRLNRRMAGDIYVGVAPLYEEEGRLRLGETRDVRSEDAPPGGDDAADGESAEADTPAVEHAVVMRRIPRGVTLKERVDAGALKMDEVERIGRTLAELHASHRLQGGAARAGLPSRFGRVIRRNLKASRQGVPALFPASVHAGLETRMARRLWQTRGLLRRRVAEERIVDGHGDIRLEHVLRFQGRTAIIDCCEFNDLLRHIDPVSDAAFLAMDLLAHGRADLAWAFEQSYLEHAGELDGHVLLPLYRAYRAQVRAMVDEQSCRDALIDREVRKEKERGARRCMALAWTQARKGAPQPLIVLRGAAGTGKSWLATRLAPWLGAQIIRSDVVRKELLGLEPNWRPDETEKQTVYGAEMHKKTYAQVLTLARECVDSGHAAFLDATYLRREARDLVRAAATEMGVPFVILDVSCKPEIVVERLIERAERDDDASDADQGIYAEMMRSAEPIGDDEAPFTVAFESGPPAEEAVLPIVEAIERQVDQSVERLGSDPKPWSTTV